jgi:uncharacterized protein YbaR (Trm112 family)
MKNLFDIVFLEDDSPCADCIFRQYCAVLRTACPDFRTFVATGYIHNKDRKMTQRIYNKMFVDGYVITDEDPILFPEEEEDNATL